MSCWGFGLRFLVYLASRRSRPPLPNTSPGADPGNVHLRIERIPRLHVPPLPKDVAVTERGATTRSWCLVRATLHGICVVILAHPHSPEHRGTFVFSQTL